jgi:hypothetical protein
VRGAPPAVLGWAALLTALAAVLYAWTPGAELQWGPLAGAAGGAWLLGLFLLLRRARAGLRLVPDLSFATVALALGVATLLNGASFGRWLVFIGCGIVLAGLAGLVRELLAMRRAPPRAGLTSPRKVER